MKAQFIETNKSGKGLAGPEADAELELPEFLGLLVRLRRSLRPAPQMKPK